MKVTRYWETRTGVVVHFSEMGDQHLTNTIAMLYRNIESVPKHSPAYKVMKKRIKLMEEELSER